MCSFFFPLQKTEKTEFLSFFYKHCMHVLSAPLLANTTEEKPSKGIEYLRGVCVCTCVGFVNITLRLMQKYFMLLTTFILLLDDFQTSQLLALILELLTFCVEHHTYHIKNYIINKDILRRVLVLTASQHAFLALCESHIITTRSLILNTGHPGQKPIRFELNVHLNLSVPRCPALHAEDHWSEG